MGFLAHKIVQIVIAIVIPFIGAWVVGYGSQKNMYPWYDLINRPMWGPPDWVFAPVWSFLYALMGYASYRVYSNGAGFSGVARAALLLYIAQLLLNWTWPQVFFNLHMLGAAAIHISVLLVFILLTAVSFYRVDPLAGVLIVPYAAWVSFATALTISIWRLNTY